MSSVIHPEPSRDILIEQAYLISRGVRPMALVGEVVLVSNNARQAHDELLNAAGGLFDNVIPFVIPNGDGTALVGYAAETWIVDLLRWMAANAPGQLQDCVLGLLLGYSPRAIAEYSAKTSTAYHIASELGCASQDSLGNMGTTGTRRLC